MKTKNIMLCLTLCLTSFLLLGCSDEEDDFRDYGVVTATVLATPRNSGIVYTRLISTNEPEKTPRCLIGEEFCFPRNDLKDMEIHKDDVISFKIVKYEHFDNQIRAYDTSTSTNRMEGEPVPPPYCGRVVPID